MGTTKFRILFSIPFWEKREHFVIFGDIPEMLKVVRFYSFYCLGVNFFEIFDIFLLRKRAIRQEKIKCEIRARVRFEILKAGKQNKRQK